jgi:hypothetical protein
MVVWTEEKHDKCRRESLYVVVLAPKVNTLSRA